MVQSMLSGQASSIYMELTQACDNSVNNQTGCVDTILYFITVEIK